MDTPPTAPTAAAPTASHAGDLDMDVNPTASIPTKAPDQPRARDTVQDGIAPLNPLNAPASPGTPTTPLTASPATPASLPASGPTPPPAPTVGVASTEAPTAPASPTIQPPAPEPVTLDHPKVINTAQLQAGETSVSLYGIEGLAGDSAQGLQGFLSTGDGHITCQAQASSGFVCLMADGTNVAQVALVNGAAKTTDDAPESYREQEVAAQEARRGIWANLPPPPETVKHPIVQDTATLTADGKTYVLDGVVGFSAPYNSQLQGYIAGNGDSMTCSPQGFSGHFICLLPDGTDIAKVALVNGAARVAPDATDSYRVQQLAALNNRRGYWLTATDAVMTAALLPPPDQAVYALVAGDDGVDGITYVGGEPMAEIDGEAVFLIYGDDDLGWGYYDHYHHWRGAPDRFRHHLDHFHPHGMGLRGHDPGHREMAGRGEIGGHGPGLHQEALAHQGEFHPGGGRPGEVHPGGVHPGEVHASGVRPGAPGAVGGAHPNNMAMAGGHPGFGGAGGGGFVHPGAGASAGGFHPGGGGGSHPVASHPSGGGGGGKRK